MTTRAFRAVVLLLAVAGALLPTAASGARTVTLPPVNATFDYQIGGSYPPAHGVRIVDRDRLSTPAKGIYSICYVNAFQTQAEEDSWWRKKHPTLLLHDSAGHLVEDPGWPGEYLLNTRTATSRSALLRIIGAWFDSCAHKGFRAVEPDNLDSWTRSKGLLTRAENLAFARSLVARGHADGLAVAQKNAAELGSTGRSKARFDFAIAEECQVYAECSAYTSVYGRHVIEIEYSDNPLTYYTAACRARGARISITLRDREVMPRGSTDYVDRHC